MIISKYKDTSDCLAPLKSATDTKCIGFPYLHNINIIYYNISMITSKLLFIFKEYLPSSFILPKVLLINHPIKSK